MNKAFLPLLSRGWLLEETTGVVSGCDALRHRVSYESFLDVCKIKAFLHRYIVVSTNVIK